MFKKKQVSASLLARILVKRTSHFDLFIFFCIRVKPIDTTNDEREKERKTERERFKFIVLSNAYLARPCF